jgi:AraC-like DNA-binding protein
LNPVSESLNKQEASPQVKSPLLQSLDDARTLLAFASSNSRTAPISDLVGFEATIEAAAANDATTISLEKFWVQYRALVSALSPVTAQSIRATRGLQSRLLYSARVWLAMACILVFLVIVAIQVVWGYGTTYRQNLDKHDSVAKELTLKQYAEKVKFEDRKSALDVFKADKKMTPDELTKREQALEESKTAISIIQREYDANNVSIQASIDLYRSWYAFEWLPLSKKVDTIGTLPVPTSSVDVEKLKQNGTLLTEGLQRFGSSILMGLLGTLVFLLRDIESQVRLTIYRGAPAASMFIRCVLGMIGGMFGSLFMPAEVTSALVKGLPAMAFSFLVGYSVELFFGFLDKIVGAFKPTAPVERPVA